MSGDGCTSPSDPAAPRSAAQAAASADLVLIGTGQVGRALLERLATSSVAADLRLVAAGNSRGHRADPGGLAPEAVLRDLPDHRDGAMADWSDVPNTSDAPTRIIIDATASESIADRHADWLRAGCHVVTANKLGNGAALHRWSAIEQARDAHGRHYGDSATVGAGLPLLRTIRDLRRGGDRIHALTGVLSGTLAWLFDRYDGSRPFSDFVREAQRLGYTEPDPWQDLSGQDVMRKLLILARAAGHALDVANIALEPLLPPDRTGDWQALDRAVAGRCDQAQRQGKRLRFVARLATTGNRIEARVGLEALYPNDAIAAGGSDNRVAIASCRYRDRPVLIQGPGAGPDVTAAAVLDDILAIARSGRDAWAVQPSKLGSTDRGFVAAGR